MEWNPGVMRKFATTSHTRVIQQLLSEFRHAATRRNQKSAPPVPPAIGQAERLEHHAASPAAGRGAGNRRATGHPGQDARPEGPGDGKTPRGFRNRLDTVNVR